MSQTQQHLMAAMASQASSADNGATEYYHELINAGDALALEEGENWLRLVIAKAGNNNNVLDDTQDAMPLGAPFPSILSLKEVGSIDAPSSDCFICIDVDGPFTAVKDMRPLTDGSPSDDEDDDQIHEIEVCIQRRKFPVQEDDDDDDDDEETNYHPPDVLPRRQLRLLCPSDRICTRRQQQGSDQNRCGLVLSYKRGKISEGNRKQLSASSQQSSTQDSTVQLEGMQRITSAHSMASSANSETVRSVSQVSNKLITQRSQQSTIIEGPDGAEAESSEDEDLEYDDDPDKTQVFPAPIGPFGTQSPNTANRADLDDETPLEDSNEISESMDQPTQPFSYDGTVHPLQQIMDVEEKDEQKEGESDNKVEAIDDDAQEPIPENDVDKSMEPQVRKPKVFRDQSEQAGMDSNKGGTIADKGSGGKHGIDGINDSETPLGNKEGAERKLVTDAAADSDASTVLDDEDVLEQKSGDKTTSSRKDQIHEECIVLPSDDVETNPEENLSSEILSVSNDAAIPAREVPTNGLLKRQSPQEGNNEDEYMPPTNDDDDDSDETALSVDEESENPTPEVQGDGDGNVNKDAASAVDVQTELESEAIVREHTTPIDEKASARESNKVNQTVPAGHCEHQNPTFSTEVDDNDGGVTTTEDIELSWNISTEQVDIESATLGNTVPTKLMKMDENTTEKESTKEQRTENEMADGSGQNPQDEIIPNALPRSPKASPAILEKPKYWASPSKPADANLLLGLLGDPIHEDLSTSIDGLEVNRDNSDLTDPETSGRVATVKTRRTRNTIVPCPRSIIQASKTKSVTRKRKTTTSEDAVLPLGSSCDMASKRTPEPVPSDVNPTPSQETSGSISAMSETQLETQRSAQSHTPRGQKQGTLPGPSSGSQISRKRARLEGAGDPIRVLITGVDTIPRHKHVSLPLT
jgi:hypothetical protein